jgi:voltage-gated potassium channel
MEFAMKCIVSDSPFAVIFFMLIVVMSLGGFAIRVFERTQEADSDDFSTYNNSIWLVILTLTTVGYGDSDPSTNIGRIVGVLVCL